MDNNISFKSKIRFVDYKTFMETVKNTEHFVYPTGGKNFYIKENNFYTKDIRTCTGGGLTDSQNNALGFHIFDSLNTECEIDNISQEILKAINVPNLRGLLIGSKDLCFRPYSKTIFKKLQENFSKKIKNLSIFKEHLYFLGETHCHYDLNTDTWTICSRYKSPRPNEMMDVKSKNQLRIAFKKIVIAEGDELYINNDKITL